MKILVDADALPSMVRDVLYRAAERVKMKLIMVANQIFRVPASEYIFSQASTSGPDAADHLIVEFSQPGDLIITADIPLANRVVEKGATALNPRGEIYTKSNIGQKLAVRDFMESLRNSEIQTDGPAPFKERDRRKFAQSLDSILSKI